MSFYTSLFKIWLLRFNFVGIWLPKGVEGEGQLRQGREREDSGTDSEQGRGGMQNKALGGWGREDNKLVLISRNKPFILVHADRRF